jgi:hypothetical protein
MAVGPLASTWRGYARTREIKMKVRSSLVWPLAVLVTLLVGGLFGAEPPESPPVSKFAPAEDLVEQLDEYVEDLEDSVASEEEYRARDNLGKDANTLILIALALAVHDQDNKYKKAGPGIMKAAQQLAGATDYASAKAGVEAVKAALSSEGDAAGLSWGKKNASMSELMKAVPRVNTRLKRYMRRFSRYADRVGGNAAVVAVIGQGSMPNAVDTEKPDQVEKWYQYCIEMRDAAGALTAACHAEDEDAAEKAMEALQKSCDDCHEVFHEDHEDIEEEE